MNNRVLIVGGYGVFGGRLASGVMRDGMEQALVAGRDRARAEAFCRQNGGIPVVLDRTAPDLNDRVAALSPAIVVDAAGPFQVIRCGSGEGGAGPACLAGLP